MNNYNPKRPRPTPASSAAAQVDGLIGPAPDEVIDIADKPTAGTTESTGTREQTVPEPSPQPVDHSAADAGEPDADIQPGAAASDERPHHLEIVSDMDLPTAGQVAVAEPPKGKIIAAIIASGLGVSAGALAIWWWITRRNNKS